jgi:ribonuclease Z
LADKLFIEGHDMAKLIFLGSASAVAFEGHGNSYLVLKGKKSSLLIDCAADPLLRLKKAGVSPDDISDIIITHFHPDHVSGLPNFLMDMWLLGRQEGITIHGSEHTLTRVKQLMDLFDWSDWEKMYPVEFHCVARAELAEVVDTKEFIIKSSPVEHLIPTLGLRIEYPEGDFICAYSSDTSPIPETVGLAHAADVLIHEAAGPHFGHSTALQAGEIASLSGVRSLYLIHYGFHGGVSASSLLAEAKKTFPGEVCLAEDFMEIEMKKS